ncbi:ABC transporter permease [Nocardioides humi]|uniref:ABC transporter permease n=1 Tax=Nocardioides humi TaxID=449461 RepID=UPI0011264CD3|nr:ABC transporter permease [Nocardioides humi]
MIGRESSTRRGVIGTTARRVGRWAWSSKAEFVCVVVIALLFAVALLGPLIQPYDPNANDYDAISASASLSHPLGTDALGRDVLSRLIAGARPSMIGAIVVVVLATAVGTAIALFSAWFGGWVDALVSRVLDFLMSFPALLLAFMAVSLFGPGLVAPVIAISIHFTPYFSKIIRGAALRERGLSYVAAAQVLGFSGLFIARRHLLPNVAPLILVQSAMTFGYAMLNLAALAYLGLGVQPPAADWGLLIATGQQGLLEGHPLEALSGCAMVLISVFAFTVLGQQLASRFGVRR